VSAVSTLRALAVLVRAPAALTVLGDTVAGAAAAGQRLRGRRLLLPVASTCLYWAGMALNDYADRELDAVERPERPLPSGRVRPAQALAVAAGLTGAGVALAGAAGGRRAVRVALPLAATVWAYDLWLKRGPLGPLAMGACRGLDVLLGAAGAVPGSAGAGGSPPSRAWASHVASDERRDAHVSWAQGRPAPRPRGVRGALPAAVAVAGHTVAVTALARGEVHGAPPAVAWAACGGTAAVGTVAVLGGSTPSRGHRLLGAAAAAGYAATVGRAQWTAARDPRAATVRRATVAGIHGMVPLQASVAARAGSVLGAVALLAAVPVVRVLARAVSPT
jgi:4-hydroxybenzoate polyprenyltransferase